MLQNILNEYKNFANPPFIGVDGKYHTVYYIEFDNGCYYIGKHSSTDISNDGYFCSGKLANTMKNKGFSYTRNILFFLETAPKAIDLETSILSKKKYYDNPLCLNCYPGSPTDNTNTIIISKNNKFKMINPKLLEWYLERGWERKGVKRIGVNKSGVDRFILHEEVDEYLSDGWNIGISSSKDRIFINKDDELRFVKKYLLDQYLSDGWEIKHNITGNKVLRNNEGKIVKVKPQFVDSLIEQGFYHSSTVHGLIYIHKNGEYKRVVPEDVNNYLSDGWKKGNNTSGKVYITNNITEKRISPDDLHLYDGWVIGRVKKIYLNNGVIERRLSESDIISIGSLLADGWSIGKLIRPKKIIIYKDKNKKMINPSELPSFIDDGWTNIFDKNIHYHPRLG